MSNNTTEYGRFKVRLVVEIEGFGPRDTDDVVRFAAESVHHEAVSLQDAECQVFFIGEDGSESGAFYRTTAYQAVLEEVEEADSPTVIERCGDVEPETQADAHPWLCARFKGHRGAHAGSINGPTWPNEPSASGDVETP